MDGRSCLPDKDRRRHCPYRCVQYERSAIYLVQTVFFLTVNAAAFVTQVMSYLYLRMVALYRVATEPSYRKEMIGGAFGQRLVDG